MWVPQAVRAVRNRRSASSLAGISPVTYLAAIVFNALLVTYGLLNHARPVVVAGCINVVCASVIETVVLMARRPVR